MNNENYRCPGHPEGEECPFCKSKYGHPRYVGDKIQMNKTYEVNPSVHKMEVVMTPVVDSCCKACAQNLKAQEKQYEKTSIS